MIKCNILIAVYILYLVIYVKSEEILQNLLSNDFEILDYPILCEL